MNNNFTLFFLSYFIILTSTLGYGLLFSGIFEKRNNYNFGHIGLIGIFFLILYSYFSNVFLAHSEIHNIILLTIGLILFLIFFKKNFKNIKKEFLFVFIIFYYYFLHLLFSKIMMIFPIIIFLTHII